jgi:hypothetical protein
VSHRKTGRVLGLELDAAPRASSVKTSRMKFFSAEAGADSTTEQSRGVAAASGRHAELARAERPRFEIIAQQHPA